MNDAITNTFLHPVQSVFLASTVPLSLGALLCDWTYASTFHVQWLNFAAWLLIGFLVFMGLAILWAIIDFFRTDLIHNRQSILFLGLMLTTFILGFTNSLVHAKDGWASMPAGLILSALLFPLTIAALWLGYSKYPLRVAA